MLHHKRADRRVVGEVLDVVLLLGDQLMEDLQLGREPLVSMSHSLDYLPPSREVPEIISCIGIMLRSSSVALRKL